MLTRKRRFLVGSVSSLVWPAITLLLPMGITFAAARVYAESAPAPEACDASIVIECADAAVGAVCKSCSTGTCACFSGMCKSGDTFSPNGNTCRPIDKCESLTDAPQCVGKKVGDSCPFVEGELGSCVVSTGSCVPNDGGPATSVNYVVCAQPPGASSSSSSGATSGSTSGGYIPGPDKVPGSSGAANTPASSNDDSGCATSSSTTIPLFAAPIAIGLLFALRRRQPKKEPSARKRS